MKKTIYILSAICLMAVISVSCDKDFLTKTPETKVTSGSFFHSPTELALWTNNFYVNQLSGADDYADATADDHMTTSLAGIQKGTITPNSANGWTSAEWKKLRNINYFFENCDRCEDAAARAQYEGVAHFFRAMFYFDKVKRFGDVPYYETTVGSGDDEMLYKARDPRGYVMLKVIQDLDKAIEQLPDTPASPSLREHSGNTMQVLSLSLRMSRLLTGLRSAPSGSSRRPIRLQSRYLDERNSIPETPSDWLPRIRMLLTGSSSFSKTPILTRSSLLAATIRLYQSATVFSSTIRTAVIRPPAVLLTTI